MRYAAWLRPMARSVFSMRTAIRLCWAVLLAGLVIILVQPFPLDQPNPHHDGQPSLTERLTRTVSRHLKADDVAGAVVVVIRQGKPVWTGAFGMADPDTGRAMTPDALFRVESISKPVTAWGVMRLAEDGKLDLDAPITSCLVRWQPPPEAAPMTIRQLLSHSAGVGLGDFAARYAPGEARPTLPQHMTEDFSMIAPPGARFSYSDTGYNLLELLVEDCTGEDFEAFMAREVMEPLGMRAASFDWTGADMPVGHDTRGRPVAPYVYPGRGSGGLMATAEDIARFAVAGMTGSDQDVLSDRAVAALHRPEIEVGGLFGLVTESYGLGHFTETLSDGRAAVWHGGQGHGWMSHIHLVPETGDGVVILSNSQRAWPLFAAILRDWSSAIGAAPVGMARVLWAERMARAAILLALACSALVLSMVIRRRRRGLVVRIVAGGVGQCLLLWPICAAAQDYLFIFSILPTLWPWLGAASGLAGLCLVLFALWPQRQPLA